MSLLTKISALPLELCTKVLQPLLQAGEAVICLQIPSIGNFTPFRMRGRTNRTYRFEWDRNLLCHVLRIPASLWALEGGALARDIFHQLLTRPVIPTVELPVAGVPEVKEEPVVAAKKAAGKKVGTKGKSSVNGQ